MGNRFVTQIKIQRVFISLFIFTILLIFGNKIPAQELTWAIQAGGSAYDSNFDIAVDAAGNSYVTGDFSGSATFGAGEANETTLTSDGVVDIYIAKYDNAGLLQWAKRAGGSELNQGFTITLDAAGNSYVAGFFEGTATFGPGEANATSMTSTGSRDIFIAKYNDSGLLQWAKQAGGRISNDHATGIIADADQNCYLTGFYNDSTTFGPGEANEVELTSSGSFDIYVAKYIPDGLLQWAKIAGGAGFDIGSGISLDAAGNFYITGFFQDAAIFGSGETNETTLTGTDHNDVYIAKYDANGALQWAKSATGAGLDESLGIFTDAAGNSVITGYFEASLTFGAGETNEMTIASTDLQDVFIARFDANGMLQWAAHAGGSGDDKSSEITADAAGNSFITGHFEEEFTAGAGEANETALTSFGGTDVFVAKYGPAGMLHWDTKAGASNMDFAAGIDVDAAGSVYASGFFEVSAIFGQGEVNETILRSAGNSDLFIAKFMADSPTSIEPVSQQIKQFELAQNYPNPFNPLTHIGFRISDFGFVRLAVFDVSGRLVKTLVNETREAGEYTIPWDATDKEEIRVSSGIYFYQLTISGFTATKKMLLMR